MTSKQREHFSISITVSNKFSSAACQSTSCALRKHKSHKRSGNYCFVLDKLKRIWMHQWHLFYFSGHTNRAERKSKAHTNQFRCSYSCLCLWEHCPQDKSWPWWSQEQNSQKHPKQLQISMDCKKQQFLALRYPYIHEFIGCISVTEGKEKFQLQTPKPITFIKALCSVKPGYYGLSPAMCLYHPTAGSPTFSDICRYK